MLKHDILVIFRFQIQTSERELDSAVICVFLDGLTDSYRF